MAVGSKEQVIAEAAWASEDTDVIVKKVVLFALGIVFLTVAAKLKVSLWPSPVPITFGSFAVMAVAVAYGPTLGFVTVTGYIAVGAAGFDVFSTSSEQNNGINYLLGGTGGYILGYAAAALYLGWAGRRRLDRSVEGMGGALLVANVIIYVPGLYWLRYWIDVTGRYDPNAYGSLWSQTLEWGLYDYLLGDLIKLALAALLLPAMWRLVRRYTGR